MKIWRKRITDSVNDEAVYRTAPATPGLLMISMRRSIQADKMKDTSGESFEINEDDFDNVLVQKQTY